MRSPISTLFSKFSRVRQQTAFPDSGVRSGQPSFPGIQVGSDFDRSILSSVIYGDEYGLAGCRFQAQDVIVDIGAHIGVFTVLCHRKGSRSIYAYEPSTRNFALLKTNTGGLSGVECAQAAVWRSDGAGSPLLRLSGPSGENSGSSSVLARGAFLDFAAQKPGEDREAAEDAESIPLDRILERFERVKLLKIDCEGSEFPILLTSRLLQRVERIVGEIHECGEAAMTHLIPEARVPGYEVFRAADLVERLEAMGFHLTLRPNQSDPALFLFEARRPLPVSR